jgi:regulator of RNase E activity RraB
MIDAIAADDSVVPVAWQRKHVQIKSLRRLVRACMLSACLATLPAAAQMSIAEQQDGRVIENLVHNGANITKVHDIDFFLVFRREQDAMVATGKLRDLRYKIAGVAKTANGKQWEVHAKRDVVPSLEAMQAATRNLQALAAASGGYYDGWGTVGVK